MIIGGYNAPVISNANLWGSMKRLKGLSIKICLVCFGILVAFLILEGILRLQGITGYQDRLSIYQFDDTLGWIPKPNTRYFRSNRDYAHYNYFGPQGFPASKQDWHKSLSKSLPTIAFIGDSFSESYYLPYELTFPYLVGNKFPAKQVMNLGVSGYAPGQYLITARRHLGAYNTTDIIVTFFPHNDIPDFSKSTYQGYSKPLFEDSLAKPANTPLNKLSGGVGRGGILRSINDRSAVIRAINPSLFKYFPGLGRFGSDVISEPIYIEETAMRRALLPIKQIALEFPVETFIVYYISRYEELLQPGLFKQNIDLFHKLCEELAMRCFSTASIAAKVSDPADLYLPTDRHFTKLGARLVADQFYEILSGDES